MMAKSVVWFLLLAGAQVQPVEAAESAGTVGNNIRPKVGLALSGGGSKAGAHIGVLRVLEANRIPVDYIAGTSAGAIVGGLYAAGMSPDEIEQAIGGIDWADILDDKPQRQDLPFRRKRDDLNYLVKYRPGYSDGSIKLPLGLVEGQKVTGFLRRQVEGLNQSRNFDALPIPLRVVATDLETGQPVVIGSGDLAIAIRASMAIPVFFSPVTLDGRRLVDGGPANNLPIDVVRDMGADVVIAVDITAPLLSGDQLDSVLAVADQMTNVLTQRTVAERVATLGENDVLLRPDLSGIGGMDFERTLEAVAPGASAAKAALEQLQRYVVDDAAYRAYRSAHRQMGALQSTTIGFVEINNGSKISSEIIRKGLGFEVGDVLDKGRIEHGIANVYAYDLFERIDYRIEERDAGSGVSIDVVPKSWGPSYLQFGLQLAEDFSSGSDFNIGIAYLQTAANSLGGEWRAQLDIGQFQGLSLNWFQPVSRHNRNFVEADAFIQRRYFRFYDEQLALADLRVDGWGGRLAVGTEIGASGEVRAGWNRFTGDANVVVGELDLTDDEVDIGEYFASMLYDRIDNANFPRHGVSAGIGAVWSRESAGASEDFEQVTASLLAANSWNAYSVLATIEAGTTLDDDAPLQSQFLLGGLGRLSGFPANRFFGQHYALANVTAYKRLNQNQWLPTYAGVSIETGSVWNDRDSVSGSDLRLAGAVYAGAESPLGPLYLAWGLAEGGENTVYLYLGSPFVAAGRRPFD